MCNEGHNNSNEQNFVRLFSSTIPGVHVIFYIDLTDDVVLASHTENARILDLCNIKKSEDLLVSLMKYFNNEVVSQDIYDMFRNEALLRSFANGETDVVKEVETTTTAGPHNSKIVAHLMQSPVNNHVQCILYSLDAAKEHAMKHELGDLTMLTSALSIEYTTVILINLDTDEMEFKKSDPNVNASKIAAAGINTFSAFANLYIDRFVLPKDKATMRRKMDIKYFLEQFEEKGNDRISMRYEVHPNKIGQRHFKLKVVSINQEEGHWAVLGVRCIDALVENEERDKKAISDALAAAEHANKAKSAFLNNMSHDIRTPMNAIIGFTELALKHLSDSEVVCEYLTKIKTSSQHLLSLINQVLDMSRIESGYIQLDENETTVSEVIDNLKTIMLAGIQEKRQQISIDLSGVKHDAIITDKVRLSQILINIVGNSVKYTQEGGSIEIKVTEKASSKPGHAVYEYRIKDNGMGMSEEFQQYVFESFSREKNATDSGIQGTGLGMAITKRIVDLMGGDIKLNSKLGEGTEFTVAIECQHTSKNNSDSTLTQTEVSFAGKRILLVEDNELNQEIAYTLLEDIGFVVDVACNGQEAVEKIVNSDANNYDIIMMDIQMPVMDGYEATRQIRAMEDKQKATIPIVAMTANAFEEDRLLGEKAGMNGYLTKPIDIQLIVQELAKILSPC